MYHISLTCYFGIAASQRELDIVDVTLYSCPVVDILFYLHVKIFPTKMCSGVLKSHGTILTLWINQQVPPQDLCIEIYTSS